MVKRDGGPVDDRKQRRDGSWQVTNNTEKVGREPNDAWAEWTWSLLVVLTGLVCRECLCTFFLFRRPTLGQGTEIRDLKKNE